MTSCASCSCEIACPRAWGPGGAILCVRCAQAPENAPAVRAYLQARLAPDRDAPELALIVRAPTRRCHKCGEPADETARRTLRWFCTRCRPRPLYACVRCSLPVSDRERAAAVGGVLVHQTCPDLLADLRRAAQRPAGEPTDLAAAESPPGALRGGPGAAGELDEVTTGEDLEAMRRRTAAAVLQLRQARLAGAAAAPELALELDLEDD